MSIKEITGLMPGKGHSNWTVPQDRDPHRTAPDAQDTLMDLLDRVRRPRWEYPEWALPKEGLSEEEQDNQPPIALFKTHDAKLNSAVKWLLDKARYVGNGEYEFKGKLPRKMVGVFQAAASAGTLDSSQSDMGRMVLVWKNPGKASFDLTGDRYGRGRLTFNAKVLKWEALK